MLFTLRIYNIGRVQLGHFLPSTNVPTTVKAAECLRHKDVACGKGNGNIHVCRQVETKCLPPEAVLNSDICGVCPTSVPVTRPHLPTPAPTDKPTEDPTNKPTFLPTTKPSIGQSSKFIIDTHEETSLNTSNNEVINSFLIPNGTRFCFVHVGKTAGKTVACEFGHMKYNKWYQCLGYKPAPSALHDAYAGRTHMGNNRCDKAAAFLFVMRNPLERFLSSYFYERRLRRYTCNQQLHGCFLSLEDFALHTIPPVNSTHPFGCRKLAWDVTTGKEPCVSHNAFGYSYYLYRFQQMSRETQRPYVLAIRSEHLAEDWDKLETGFGGEVSGKLSGNVRFAHPPVSQNSTMKKTLDIVEKERLSETGRKNLCRALCYEIQVYKKILEMAENLAERQVRESLQEVIDSCPGETLEIRKCPPPVYAVCSKHKGGTFHLTECSTPLV
jgi:hypothetical protein